MDKPIVRYRVMLTLAVLGLCAGLALVNRYLPAGLQLFAWGVVVGLLFMFAGVVVNWLLDQTLVVSLIVLSAISALTRYIFPFDWHLIAGEVTGLVLVIAMVMLFPLRTPAKSIPQRQARKAPLEEPSSHTMILPRDERHTDNSRSGETR